MRLLVLGDSLSFGRPNHDIGLEMTWPFLIEGQTVRTTMRSRGGALIDDIKIEVDRLVSYWGVQSTLKRPFDAVIIQQGIVDCCPRPLPRCASNIIRRIPLGSFNERAFIPRRFWRPWTSLTDFQFKSSQISVEAQNLAARVYWLEIARPSHHLLSNCGDFSADVGSYNAVLNAGSGSFLPLWSGGDPSPHLLPDGHHLSPAGHQHVAATVLNCVVSSASR